jgi:hypothetical protein
LSSKGGSSSLKYAGGTLFYDAASGYVSVQHQHSFTAAETIQSKMHFEQEAMQAGVTINTYHTDNGVFMAQEFLNERSKRTLPKRRGGKRNQVDCSQRLYDDVACCSVVAWFF